MESDAEQAVASVSMRDRPLATGQCDAWHSAALMPALRNDARESDMDACWFLAEIVKVFWYDRHPRRRKGRPSVPQVPPPHTKSGDAT